MNNQKVTSATTSVYRRIAGIIIFFLSFFIMLSLNAVRSHAYYPNFKNAQPVALNTPFKGNVTQGSDLQTNTYKLTLPSDGALGFEFKNPLQNSADSYWGLSLYNSDAKELDKFYINGNREVSYTTINGVPAGTYYLAVYSANVAFGLSGDDYTIKAVFSESNNWETEDNGEHTTADFIKTNTEYYGTTHDGYESEADYFTFTLDKPGYIKLNLHYSQIGDASAVYRYYIENAEYNQIYTGKAYGNYEDASSPLIGLDKGRYYLNITSEGFNYERTNKQYALKVNYWANDNWERESNNGFTSATPVKLGQAYRGSCRYGYNDDADYYVFKVPTGGVYRISVDNAKADSSPYWYGYVFSNNYDKLDEFIIPGNTRNTTRDITLKTGTYYLCIQSEYRFESNISPYTFKISRKPSPTSIKATKTKTKYYTGDTIKTNDIKVIVTLSDGTTKDVTSSSIITNGVNTKKAGKYKITVSYSGKKTSITIMVVDRPLKKGDKAKIKVGKTTFTYKLTDSRSVCLYSVSAGKNNLVKMTVPDTVKLKNKTYKVTSIASNAFSGCSKMNSVVVGKNVKSIGASAFTGCKKLKTITVNSSSLTKKSVKNSLKGSYVNTIKVSKSNVSKYKKIFTKANTGSRYNLTVKKK